MNRYCHNSDSTLPMPLLPANLCIVRFKEDIDLPPPDERENGEQLTALQALAE